MSDLKTSEYEPKSILLTGGAGFIGSVVVNHITKKFPDCHILMVDKLNYCSSRRNFAEATACKNFKFVKGDIRNMDFMKFLFEDFKVDTVMHYAAESHVDNSFGNSLAFSENNIIGTHVLLECSRIFKVRKFIHVSTDEVYGESDGADEKGLLEPTNPYACSKAGAEFMCKAFLRSFGVPVVITRGNNVYGAPQFPEKVIPRFISRLDRGQKCCIHGNGGSIRNYLHVKDVARAFETVLRYGQVGEIYNIGTSVGISTLDLAKVLVRQMKNVKAGEEDQYIEYVADRAFNDFRYDISSSKIHALGWKPEIDFETGIRETIDWYLKNEADYWEAGDLTHALAPHPVFNLS